MSILPRPKASFSNLKLILTGQSFWAAALIQARNEFSEHFAALARELVERRGAIQVQSADELKQQIADLLRDRSLRESLVENARAVLEKHRGATASTAKLIVDLG